MKSYIIVKPYKSDLSNFEQTKITKRTKHKKYKSWEKPRRQWVWWKSACIYCNKECKVVSSPVSKSLAAVTRQAIKLAVMIEVNNIVRNIHYGNFCIRHFNILYTSIYIVRPNQDLLLQYYNNLQTGLLVDHKLV